MDDAKSKHGDIGFEREEIMASVLYTRPMYIWYSGILRYIEANTAIMCSHVWQAGTCVAFLSLPSMQLTRVSSGNRETSTRVRYIAACQGVLAVCVKLML